MDDATIDSGVSEYIVRMCTAGEVIAFAKVIWSGGVSLLADASGCVVDEDRHQAMLDGISLDLTPVEFRLLQALSQSPGRVFSRVQLLAKAYPDDRVVTHRTADTHIKNLRRKLERARPGQKFIHSVYGIGFKFGRSCTLIGECSSTLNGLRDV